MNQPCTLAAAQTIALRGDVEGNVRRHARLVEAAAEAGAQIVVFPELSLTGYELDRAGELAFAEGDARLEPLRARAVSRGVTLVAGAPVRIGPRLHIGAFLLSPDGGIAIYTKHRLGAFPAGASPDGIVPPAEASVFQPGDRNPLVRFGGRKAAVAICADTGRPSHARDAADRGATAYLASMFVIPADLEEECLRLRSCAVRHSLTVVFANHGGPTGGLPAAGGSAIWSGTGELLARLDGTGTGLVIATRSDAGWRGESVRLPDG